MPLGVLTGGNLSGIERGQKGLVRRDHAPDRAAEGLDARLEPLEQGNPHEAAQVDPGAVQFAVGRLFAPGRLDVVPQPVARVTQMAIIVQIEAAGAQKVAELPVETVVGCLDAVLDGLQPTPGKKFGRPPTST